MFECEESAYKHWITRPQIDYVITHPVKILEVESKRKDDPEKFITKNKDSR